MASDKNGKYQPQLPPITLKSRSAMPPTKLVLRPKKSRIAEAERPSWKASFPSSILSTQIPSSNRKEIALSSNHSKFRNSELKPSTIRTLPHEFKVVQCAPDPLETPNCPKSRTHAEPPPNTNRQDTESSSDDDPHGEEPIPAAVSPSLPRKGTVGCSATLKNRTSKLSSLESEDSLRTTIHHPMKVRHSYTVFGRGEHMTTPNVQESLPQCPYFEDAERTGSETELDVRPQVCPQSYRVPSSQYSWSEDLESRFKSDFDRQNVNAERREDILSGSRSTKSVKWDPAIIFQGPVISGGYDNSRHKMSGETSALAHTAFVREDLDSDAGVDIRFERKKSSGSTKKPQIATARRKLDANLEEFAKTISQMKKDDRSKIKKILEALKNIVSDEEIATHPSLEQGKHSDKLASSTFPMKRLNPLAPAFRDLSSLKAHINPKNTDNRQRLTFSPVGKQRPYCHGSTDESNDEVEESSNAQRCLKPALTTPIQTAPLHITPIQATSSQETPFPLPDSLGSLNLGENGLQLTPWIYPVTIAFPNEVYGPGVYLQQPHFLGTFLPAPVPPPFVPPNPFPAPIPAPVTPLYVPTKLLQVLGNSPPSPLCPGRISSSSSTVTESGPGRIAQTLDQNWAEQVLGKFMSKFPMTGEQAPPPTMVARSPTPALPKKKKSGSEPNPDLGPFLPITKTYGSDFSPPPRISTKKRHATDIQQQLEEIILHKKEKKAYERLSAQVAERMPVNTCNEDLIYLY